MGGEGGARGISDRRIWGNFTSDFRKPCIRWSDFRIRLYVAESDFLLNRRRIYGIVKLKRRIFGSVCMLHVAETDFLLNKFGRIFGFLKKIDRIIGSTTPPGPSCECTVIKNTTRSSI